jgi:hypothetical protein
MKQLAFQLALIPCCIFQNTISVCDYYLPANNFEICVNELYGDASDVINLTSF